MKATLSPGWPFCLILLLCCAPIFAAAAEPFLLGGIQVNEPDHSRWVDTLGAVGMNTVSVTVYAKQGDWDSDHIWWEDDEPAVLAEIRTAKNAGLRVVLILRVAVDHAFPRNQFIWHGMIMPSNEALVDSWFRQYGDFVAKWARVAETEGVEVLGVGSEMNALTSTFPINSWGNTKNYYGWYWYQRMLRKRAYRFADQIRQKHLWVPGQESHDTLESYVDARFAASMAWSRQAYLRDQPRRLKKINERRASINAHWVELIRRARELFDGKLTYGANFDNFHEVGFWKELDILGINSYFPLRDHLNRELGDEEKRAVFVNRWRQIFDDVRGFRARAGVPEMPVMFTELGYTTKRSSTVQPWAHSGFAVIGWGTAKRRLVVWKELPIDLQERALAVDALHQVRGEFGPLSLAGILYWKLSTRKEQAAIEPFMLHIGADSTDPLQEALLKFTQAGRTGSTGDRVGREREKRSNPVRVVLGSASADGR